ncbi:MFS transporter [Clostridium sp. 'deep sea']|uniref:MFS transporter n=1 Tax=Clostridium sp. 'deep sea' TaxID=2779445 RepID=UPI0018964FE9|nr:MFS transporter [Clostridium sp. 'deep sea']QOR36462.1 MFS transporter [Clostridium sp. 'deep sea']
MSVYKNIKRFYLYKMLSGAIIIGPIIMLYLLNVKGLDFKQVMLLSSIAAIATVIFEVPTGAVADYWSRKASLILGSSFIAISLAFYVTARGFWGCLIAEVLFALGFAFNSGADTALLYDSLLELKQENEFQRIAGLAQSRLFWVQALGSIAAGFLYEYNEHLPMIFSAVFVCASILIIMLFKEPEVKKHENSEKKSYFKQVADSAYFTFTHKKVKALLVYVTVFFVFYRMGFFLFQPYMTTVNIPVRYIGIMFFLFNVVAALTSRNCHKIMAYTKKRTLSFLSALLIVSFLLLGVTKIWIGSFAILLQQVARGLYSPITRKYFNKHIESNMRATVLSFISLVTRLAGSLMFPLLGILKDNTSIFNTHLVLASVMLLLTILSLIYIKDKLGKRVKDIKTLAT